MKTVIQLSNHGGELMAINLSEVDATSEAITQAVIDMACQVGLHEGDVIRIFEAP